MDKMNEKIRENRCKVLDYERKRKKGFTYVGAIPKRGNERHQGGGKNEERSVWPEYKRGEIKERELKS